MKRILITITLICYFFCSNLKAQDYYFGLFSNSYQELNLKGDLITVKKNIKIIYNREYCLFSIDGKTSEFKVYSYTKEIKQGNLEESFINDDSKSINRGWYSFLITHNKSGFSSVTINLPMIPGGHFYYIQKAEVYSENGKVNSKVFVENWKELEKKSNFQDSLDKSNELVRKEQEQKQKIKDSINLYLADSIRNAKMELKLSIGNNLNNQNISWIGDTISSKVKLIDGENFYNDFKILIDSNGYITGAVPNNNSGHIIDKYLPQIDSVIKGIKIEPFIGSNGKKYPSYRTLYIVLKQGIKEEKRPKNKKLLKSFKDLVL